MLQNIPQDKILEVVKQGPTVPSRIVKIVGGDTMLIGAILSGMIGSGKIRYSNLKMGGSPLYYVPEHEEKLEEFMQYLNEKDQRTARKLKDEKVMQESTQDPLTRVSLKTIKDFAKPFEVQSQLFYRYFLTDPEEAEKLVIDMLKEQERTTQNIVADEETSLIQKEAAIHRAVSKEPENIKQDYTPEKTPARPVHVEPEVKEEEKSGVKREAFAERELETAEKPQSQTKETNEKREHPARKSAHKESKADFFETIRSHVHKLGLDIVGKEKVKKTEYVLILKNHDTGEYIYCTAKDKKNVNEGDLSTSFVFAHQKKMPCMFLMTGHLTKKAEAMREREFADMRIEEI